MSSHNLRIPKDTKKKGKDLYEFQAEGVLRLLASPTPVNYLADDMGLGKSPQSLVYANEIGAYTLLVICPASLRLNWLREIHTWYDITRNRQTAILSSKDFVQIQKNALLKRGYFPTPIVVSYDLIVSNDSLFQYLLSRPWDLVILDEFHYCRNEDAQRTQRVKKIIRGRVKKILALSGTPIENSGVDLFPICDMIESRVDYLSEKDARVCSHFQTFADKFAYQYDGKYGTTYTRIRNPTELSALCKRTKAFIRREKEQVLKDLPDKEFRRVDISLKVKHDFDMAEINAFLEDYKRNLGIKEPRQTKQTMTLRRYLGEEKAKHPETKEFLESIIKAAGCVVIFAIHRTVVSLLQEQLKKYKVVTLTGKTKPFDKQRAIDNFQNGKADVIILNIKAGGVGWTLTRARDAVFIEHEFLPTLNMQCIDRLHRIGQKNAVTGHFLVASDDMDRELISEMIRKLKSIEKVEYD